MLTPEDVEVLRGLLREVAQEIATAIVAAVPQKARSKPRNLDNSASTEVWNAYADAHQGRYGCMPVRNAKVNRQIVELIRRVGQDAIPMAQWYLEHDGWYRSRGHELGLLVRDAEKLHTEWVTGRPIETAPAALAQPAWWASHQGIDSKAKELGIQARPTESYDDLKTRVAQQMRGK